MLSANGVYHLDGAELPNILKPFLRSNKNIKALYIEENLEGEKLVSFFRKDGGKLVFNKKIPPGFTQLPRIESNITYNDNLIGRVVIYYSSKLDFTQKEKEWIKNNKKLEYIYDEDFQPFEWRGDLDEHLGIFADILKIVSQRSGIEFERLDPPYDDPFMIMKGKKAQLFTSFYENEKNKKYLDFTKHDILSVPAVLVESESNGNIYLNENYDLDNKRVVVIKNSVLKDYLKQKFPRVKLIETKDAQSGFKLLSSSRAELFALNGVRAQYLIKKKGYKDFKVYRKLDYVFRYKIAVLKDLPKEALSVLDKVLGSISEEKKSEIFHKWTTIYIQKEIDWGFVRDIALFFLALIVLVIYWNRKLKQKVDEKTFELKKLNENLELIVQEEISKNHQIQEQLFRSEKLASMGEMIGNIAHQWRQPLSVISTAATGLKLQKQLGLLDESELLRSCDTINENAQYLSKTIDDFRDFIKGDKKKEVFLLNNLMQSCTHLISSTIKNNHIKAVYDLDGSIKMEGFKNELLQCFLNLINNAKDALNEKMERSSERFIFIRTYMEGKKIYISFRDNAGGIDESIKNRIFEPYFTTKHKSQGTGLGLHMVYNIIVNGMGGDIEVENVEYEYKGNRYKGAEFIIMLGDVYEHY